MPVIASPYDNRIQRLRQRMQQKKGPTPRMRLKLLQNKQRQQRFQQRNTPFEYEDAQYDTDVGRLGRDRDFAMSDVAGRRLATEQQYGFGMDQSNPFSVAKQLEKNFYTRQGQTLGSYARQGQLYAGSLSNARNIDRTNFEQGLDTAQRQYQSEMGDLSRAELEAQRGYDEGELSARASAMERALQQPLDPAPPNLYGKKIKQLRKRLNKKKRGNKKRGKFGYKQ